MPRLSGREALRELRAVAPDVRVLFCSGYADHPADSDGPPVRGFVHKPFRPDELLESVRSALAD
jgi:DNA-binding NarL/FixJ family response regulator